MGYACVPPVASITNFILELQRLFATQIVPLLEKTNDHFSIKAFILVNAIELQSFVIKSTQFLKQVSKSW